MPLIIIQQQKNCLPKNNHETLKTESRDKLTICHLLRYAKQQSSGCDAVSIAVGRDPLCRTCVFRYVPLTMRIKLCKLDNRE